MLPYQVNVSSPRGAPMGRRSDGSENFEGLKCHLRRVPFFDGDYDEGGAYWGYVPGEPLWCVWVGELVAYVRAPTRGAAKAQFPDAMFYR